jgi:hypothetical protein
MQPLREAVQAQCEALGLELRSFPVPDSIAGDAEEAKLLAEQLISLRSAEEPEGKIAWFAVDRRLNQTIAAAALRTGGLLPGLSDASLLNAFPQAFGLDIPGDLAFDVDFVKEKIIAAADEMGLKGSIALWDNALPTVMLETAVAYFAREYPLPATQKSLKAALGDWADHITLEQDSAFEGVENTFFVSTALEIPK